MAISLDPKLFTTTITLHPNLQHLSLCLLFENFLGPPLSLSPLYDSHLRSLELRSIHHTEIPSVMEVVRHLPLLQALSLHFYPRFVESDDEFGDENLPAPVDWTFLPKIKALRAFELGSYEFTALEEVDVFVTALQSASTLVYLAIIYPLHFPDQNELELRIIRGLQKATFRATLRRLYLGVGIGAMQCLGVTDPASDASDDLASAWPSVRELWLAFPNDSNHYPDHTAQLDFLAAFSATQLLSLSVHPFDDVRSHFTDLSRDFNVVYGTGTAGLALSPKLILSISRHIQGLLGASFAISYLHTDWVRFLNFYSPFLFFFTIIPAHLF